MDRQQALDYLAQLPRFAENPGIYREQKLLYYLGNPEKQFPVIHVTGTNGKGSVCAMLAEVMGEAGVKVGLYTSPHIEEYPERIRINGQSISWEDFGVAIEAVAESAQKWWEEEKGELTEFDVLTAASFWQFAKEQVDVAIVEVGIGGTLDSTNVVNPILTMITNVGADHLDKCGPTLSDLASHKAGIVKQGVSLVSSVAKGPLREVIRARAQELNSPAFFSGEAWRWAGGPDQVAKKEVLEFSSELAPFIDFQGDYQLGLLGRHQLENGALVLAALSILRERWPQIKSALKVGLQNARWPGRFEVFFGEPTIIVDGAHNPDGARSLRAGLDEWFPNQKIRFIVGFLDDKEGSEFLKILHREGDQWIGTCPDSYRSMTEEMMMSLLAPYDGRWGGSLTDIMAEEQSEDSSLVRVICGSLYLIGPARKWIYENLVGKRDI